MMIFRIKFHGINRHPGHLDIQPEPGHLDINDYYTVNRLVVNLFLALKT